MSYVVSPQHLTQQHCTENFIFLVEHSQFLKRHFQEIDKLSFDWLPINSKTEDFNIEEHACYLYDKFITNDAKFQVCGSMRNYNMKNYYTSAHYDLSTQLNLSSSCTRRVQYELDPDNEDTNFKDMFDEVSAEAWHNLQDSFHRFVRKYDEDEMEKIFADHHSSLIVLQAFCRESSLD